MQGQRLIWLARIRTTLGVAIIVAACAVVYDHREALEKLISITPQWIAAMLALNILNVATVGVIHLVLLRPHGIFLSTIECLGLAFSNSLGNLVLPARAGLAARAIYLKRVYEFPFRSFAAITVYLVSTSMVVFSVLSGAILLLDTRLSQSVRLIGLGVLVAGLFTGTALSTPKGTTALVKRWGWRWLEALATTTTLRGAFAGFFGYTLVCLLFGWRLQTALFALGQSSEFLDCLRASLAMLVVSSMPITPGALGIREGALALAMSALGYNLEVVLLAGLLDRGAQVLVVAPLGVLSAGLLAARNPRSASEDAT